MWKLYKITVPELYNHLINIAKQEQLDVDPDALRIAANYAKGSMRNAIQNVQTMINYAGNNKITVKDATESLGAVDDTQYLALFDAIIASNVSQGLTILNTILSEGKDIGRIVSDIVEYLDMLLKAKVGNLDNMFSDSVRIKMESQAKLIKGNVVLKMLEHIMYVSKGVEYSIDPQALLDAFIVKSILFIQKNKG